MSLLTHETPGSLLRQSWRDRWLMWRDRLLASPAFRRRAAAFWPTRFIARRRAKALFDLVAGFVYSQVLLSCVRLRLFELLADGPQTASDVAERTALPLESAQRLLAAAVSLGLVERRGGNRFGLGPLGAPMLGNAAIAAMVEHHVALYTDLADPVALLRAPPDAPRTGALARYWPYAEPKLTGPGDVADDASVSVRQAAPQDDRTARYSALMAASQPLVADEILDAYSLRAHRCLMDVGGGDGSFLMAAARRHPSLRLMLFDLPEVAALARKRLANDASRTRFEVHGGSFLNDVLPKGADIASLVRVIHDHDDAAAMRILRAVRESLTDDGCLLLAEPMAETPGAEAMGDAYFGFYLMAMGHGRPRSAATLTRMLEEAGFTAVRRVATHTPLQTQLLVARCARRVFEDRAPDPLSDQMLSST